MNTTKIDLSKINQDYDSYVLTNEDRNRIQPLINVLRTHRISFKYFITISPYNFIPDNDKGRRYCSIENKFLKTKIKRFYKSPIKFLFFTEKYVDPESKHFGGLHRHFLMEEIPEGRWKYPTNSMINFLEKFAPEVIFSQKFGEVISQLHKEEQLIGYCTKQMKSKDDFDVVMDIENSDNFTDLDRKSNGLFLKSSYLRPARLLARVS